MRYLSPIFINYRSHTKDWIAVQQFPDYVIYGRIVSKRPTNTTATIEHWVQTQHSQSTLFTPQSGNLTLIKCHGCAVGTVNTRTDLTGISVTACRISIKMNQAVKISTKTPKCIVNDFAATVQFNRSQLTISQQLKPVPSNLLPPELTSQLQSTNIFLDANMSAYIDNIDEIGRASCRER